MNAFVLAGGASSRMGRDKALLEFNGRLLIERALDLVREIGLEPRICGSRPDLARFVPVVPDNYPGCGPLAGVEAALAASGSDLNLFLPVDLPLLPPAFLQWMITRAKATNAIATIPVIGGLPQPLCAVHSCRLLHGVRAALASRQFKMMFAVHFAAAAAGEAIDVFHVESLAASLIPHSWPAHPSPQQWFRNLNSPADYDEALLCLEQHRRIH